MDAAPALPELADEAAAEDFAALGAAETTNKQRTINPLARETPCVGEPEKFKCREKSLTQNLLPHKQLT